VAPSDRPETAAGSGATATGAIATGAAKSKRVADDTVEAS